MMDYYIECDAENYLHEELYVAMYYYLKDADCQRYIDEFHGMLRAFFESGQVGVHSFLFLHNFCVWLMDKSAFVDVDNALAYQYFYDDFLVDMQDNFRF